MKLKTLSLCALFLTSMIFVAAEPATSEQEFPDNPIFPFGDPPDLGTHGVSPTTGWNDTTFSFYLNASLDYFWNETIPRQNETVRVYVDNEPYDMFENNTKDTNWTDGKDFYWMNEERLWSKGFRNFFFYVEINESSNMTSSETFEILNRAPYILSPPPFKIYVDEVVEYVIRVQDDDLDPIDGDLIDHNFTNDDWWWIEWYPDNLTWVGKPKQPFVRWLNITIWDSYDQLAWYRWTIVCVESEGSGDHEPPSPKGIEPPFTRGESDPQPTDTGPEPRPLADSFLELSPNADGHELDWTPLGGGDHYVEVDDPVGSPDDDTTYISVGSGNQEDYHELADHTTESGTISDVTVWLRTKHSTGSEEFAICIYTHTTEYCTSDILDYAVWTDDSNSWATNPNTDIAWTWTEIDALQIGIKSRAIGGWSGTAYCTQGWVNVTYTASAPPPTTIFFWTGAGNAYEWDDHNNWKTYSGGTYAVAGAGVYPNANDDEAHINATANTIYLKDGANSVVTIGNLTLESGYTGTLNLSVDLVVDNAGGKDGNITINAGTFDTNGTANNQINLDGNLTISATFDEQEGIVIVQGAQTQRISVTNSQKLYQLTLDTRSTVGELYDNLTVYKILIGSGTTYKLDPATRGYPLWNNWSDVAGCGFVDTSSGTIDLDGVYGGRQANITTADASPPPTNRWHRKGTAVKSLIENATLSYFGKYEIDHYLAVVHNATFSYFNDEVTIDQNPVVEDTELTSCTLDGFTFPANSLQTENLTISSPCIRHDIYANGRVELTDSTFDETNCWVHTTVDDSIISHEHNDTAGRFVLIIGTELSKSSITRNDFASGDEVDLISGKFIMDEDGAAKSIMAQDGTTWVLGKDVADASVTLTFDDTNWAGFANDVANMGGIFAGKFYANGTVTYPHTIRAANLPATTGWRGIDSYWPSVGYEHMVHNVTMYNSRAWSTGHEALAQYSNVTFDMKGVNCGCTGALIIWEPASGSFFNDISVNGTAGNTEHDAYIMPDSSHIFIKNFVTTNHTGTDYQIKIDEGTTGEVVHFRNSNFDETKIDFWGGGEECHWISQDHNDTVGRYLVGIHAGFNSSKSYVASGWDFTGSDTVELLEGVLTIDEDAGATSFFIEETDAGIEVLSTYTFDLTTNLTNNGTLINNGTITDSAGYFNFYNTNPSGMWFNNSTVSKAKLAYYHDGFNFSVGNSANTTINDWTLEAPSGIDTAFNISYYDFNNKGSGVIWHMNATASSGSVKFCTGNLTSGETYRSYVNSVLHTEGDADSGNYYNFSYDGWSTKHIYLIWGASGPIPDVPGPGQWDSWIVGFSYEKNWISNEVRFHATFNLSHGYNASIYIWEFADGSMIETRGPNITRIFKYGFLTTEDIKLTVISTAGNRYSIQREIVLDNSLFLGILCLVLISLGTITILNTRKERRKESLVMVEYD